MEKFHNKYVQSGAEDLDIFFFGLDIFEKREFLTELEVYNEKKIKAYERFKAGYMFSLFVTFICLPQINSIGIMIFIIICIVFNTCSLYFMRRYIRGYKLLIKYYEQSL